MIFSKGNTVKLSPKIEIDNNQIVINIDPKEKPDDLIKMINIKLKRADQPLLTDKQIQELKESVFSSKNKSSGKPLEINLKKEIDLYAPYRTFVKIAYELGFYFLGENYLDDETGEILRRFILDPDPESELIKKYKIEGKIRFIDPNDNIEKRFKNINENSNIHIFAIFRNKHIIAVYILIFSTYEGIIYLSRNPDKYKEFELEGYLVFMDAKNSTYKILNAKEEDLVFILEKFP